MKTFEFFQNLFRKPEPQTSGAEDPTPAVTPEPPTTPEPEIPLYQRRPPRSPHKTREWSEELGRWVTVNEPADPKPIVGQQMLFPCEANPNHPRYVGTWMVLRSKRPGRDVARLEGPSPCPLCQAEYAEQNKVEAKRHQAHIPADPEPQPRNQNVNPYVPGQNVDPQHDNLPPYDHSCGRYRR